MGFWRSRTPSSLDAPASQRTFARGINAFGDIVGEYYDAADVAHGYLRKRDGIIISLDAPGAAQTVPIGINLFGKITGAYWDASGVHGFLWSGQFVGNDDDD